MKNMLMSIYLLLIVIVFTILPSDEQHVELVTIIGSAIIMTYGYFQKVLK